MKGYDIQFQERAFSIAETLVNVARIHRKKYCWPSQIKILNLLEKYQSLEISRRTLNRDLKWLEDNGYISRLRRIRMSPDRKLIFCSTLYKFKGKLFNYLHFLRNSLDRIFCLFRVPKWAHNKATARPKVRAFNEDSGKILWYVDRDGVKKPYPLD